MRKFLSVLAVMALSTCVFAQYSEDFESKTITDLEDIGWTFSPWGDPAQFVSIETTITHSGSQALRLPRKTRAMFPIDDFGTLSMWVYDAGVVFEGDNKRYGPNWGLAKDNNWIGGSLQHRNFLNSAAAYAVNLGNSGNTVGDSLFNMSWLDAGSYPDPSRGVAGWTHWEITYHEPGKIQIDLLEDPNGLDSRRHAGALGGIGDAASDGAFSAASVGGATGIYMRGCTDPLTDDASGSLFGELIVDDITWTPKVDNGKPGDANSDDVVNLDDFIILKQNYGATNATWAQGDFNADGTVDLDDFIILKQNYGS